MNQKLAFALKEYREASRARYACGQAVWVDEHQKRELRFSNAVNLLLQAALEDDENRGPNQDE